MTRTPHARITRRAGTPRRVTVLLPVGDCTRSPPASQSHTRTPPTSPTQSCDARNGGPGRARWKAALRPHCSRLGGSGAGPFAEFASWQRSEPSMSKRSGELRGRPPGVCSPALARLTPGGVDFCNCRGAAASGSAAGQSAGPPLTSSSVAEIAASRSFRHRSPAAPALSQLVRRGTLAVGTGGLPKFSLSLCARQGRPTRLISCGRGAPAGKVLRYWCCQVSVKPPLPLIRDGLAFTVLPTRW